MRQSKEKATVTQSRLTLVTDGDDKAAEDGWVDDVVDVELLAVLGEALERSLERLDVRGLQLLLALGQSKRIQRKRRRVGCWMES